MCQFVSSSQLTEVATLYNKKSESHRVKQPGKDYLIRFLFFVFIFHYPWPLSDSLPMSPLLSPWDDDLCTSNHPSPFALCLLVRVGQWKPITYIHLPCSLPSWLTEFWLWLHSSIPVPMKGSFMAPAILTRMQEDQCHLPPLQARNTRWADSTGRLVTHLALPTPL